MTLTYQSYYEKSERRRNNNPCESDGGVRSGVRGVGEPPPKEGGGVEGETCSGFKTCNRWKPLELPQLH